MDNIFTERLWRSVKYEEVYLSEYETPRDARRGLARYLSFYNEGRPHRETPPKGRFLDQALGYRTPAQVYKESVCSKEEEGSLEVDPELS